MFFLSKINVIIMFFLSNINYKQLAVLLYSEPLSTIQDHQVDDLHSKHFRSYYQHNYYLMPITGFQQNFVKDTFYFFGPNVSF